MKREEFEHVIRAAAAVVSDEIVVIGSQAIHGEVVSPPPSLLVSREVDVYPRSMPQRAIEIDGAIGDGSYFDSTWGYYAHGVGPETAKAPAGWEGRLVRVDVPPRGRQGGAVAWCLSAHDLMLAKLVAGRAHDFEFVEKAIGYGIVDRDQLRLGVDLMEDRYRSLTKERLDAVIAHVDHDL